VLELMRRKESGQVESLLEYGEQTAGRIMNPAVFALNEDLTVGEAITALQARATSRWCSISTSSTRVGTWSA
jgi:Mg/Co/Ni transporter MgtE